MDWQAISEIDKRNLSPGPETTRVLCRALSVLVRSKIPDPQVMESTAMSTPASSEHHSQTAGASFTHAHGQAAQCTSTLAV